MPSIIGPNLLVMFLSWSIFYYIFNLLYHAKISAQRRIITSLILLIISIILNVFLRDYGIFFIMILMYFSFGNHKRTDYYLINIIVLSVLIRFLITMISIAILIHFYSTNLSGSYEISLVINLMYFVIASAFVYFFNYFKLTNYFQTRKSAITGIILGYIYITFDMMYLFLQHFNLRYAILIAGILLFILIQAFFIIIIFFISRRRQKKVYQDKFTEEQVENLKSYTDRLEKDQLKLRHFKHDYKNLLFSLRTVADEQDYDAMNQALDNLENYSDDYLNNLSMDLYKDLNNVKNPYLKSLFISKLNTINKNNIVSYFNCYDELTDVPINILDLINLLSQAIDNAIEYTKDQEHGAIQLSITKEDQQLAFLINNTVSKVPTTKKETDGLEKLHIKNLKKKYSNIFIQYSKNDKWFRFHITLITKGD
ncbi:GHKL domain-containing protein [Companilactobacillus kimchiensis]|nr:GHKL domain-containing protein [Companilactobacillus kimchiensis]